MTTGLKMLASAVVAAALTAALFLTFQNDPAPPPAPLPAPLVAGRTTAPDMPEMPPLPSPGDAAPFTGHGVITGRVTTAEGEGVAGVVIVAQPIPVRSAPGTRPAPPDADVERAIQQAVEATRRRVTGTRRATSGADGAYRITGLGDAGFHLRPYAEHYTVRAVRGQNDYDVKPGDTVDFTANQVVAVRVLVEGFDLSSADRITIQHGRDEEILARAGGTYWSPESPVLFLPPGKGFLQATQGRNRERKSTPVEIDLAFGGPETTVVLRLKERPGLEGTVIVDPALAVPRLEVKALLFTSDAPPDVEDRMVSRNALRGRYDQRTGKYHFREITSGRYFVWVTLSGEKVRGSAVVEIADRIVTQDLEVGVPDRAAYVALRILGPDGEPADARQISVLMEYHGGSMNYTGPAEAIALTDGTWLLHPEPPIELGDDQKAGASTIKVSHREFGSREVPCDPQSRRALECRFEKPIDLKISIPGLSRAGLVGSVSLYLKTSLEKDGLSLSGGGARLEGETYHVKNAQPGEWLLVLIARVPRGFVVIDRLPVTITRETDHLDWPLPTLHTVTVSPADPEKRATFRLIRIDPAGDFLHQFGQTRQGEDLVFSLVPPGNYELEGSYDGEERKIPISVPGQTHIVVE